MIPATRIPVPEKRLHVRHWMKPNTAAVVRLPPAPRARNVKTWAVKLVLRAKTAVAMLRAKKPTETAVAVAPG